MSKFADPLGVAIFVEFANKVKRDGEGYLDYVWQWKDDPNRLEPKESYVKGFTPWGWVIGTGIYTDDVRAEIDRLERNLVQVPLFISGAVIFLLRICSPSKSQNRTWNAKKYWTISRNPLSGTIRWWKPQLKVLC